MRRKCLLVVVLPAWLVAGCSLLATTSPEDCVRENYSVGTAAVPDSAPFRYPLDQWQPGGAFQAHHSSGVFKNKFHVAEDCAAEPGTPVYAIGQGVISYSGPMGGYGWLIIVDHPEHNVYSLYGHLSPRRWKKETGFVKKGEIIAHIGDSDENGSGRKYGQIYPHLHFGIRRGERGGYGRWGDRRWQAGWTRACPGTIGWLSPSRFIDSFRTHFPEEPSESAFPAFRRSMR